MGFVDFFAKAIRARKQDAEHKERRKLNACLIQLGEKSQLRLAVASALGNPEAQAEFARLDEDLGAAAGRSESRHRFDEGAFLWERLRIRWDARGRLWSWIAKGAARQAGDLAPAIATGAAGALFCWPWGDVARIDPHGRFGWLERALSAAHWAQLQGLWPRTSIIGLEMAGLALIFVASLLAIAGLSRAIDEIGSACRKLAKKREGKRMRARVERACRLMLESLREKEAEGAPDLEWLDVASLWGEREMAAAQSMRPARTATLLAPQGEFSVSRFPDLDFELAQRMADWTQAQWGAKPKRLTRRQLRDLRVRRALANGFFARCAKRANKAIGRKVGASAPPEVFWGALAMGFPLALAIVAMRWAAPRRRMLIAARRKRSQKARDLALGASAAQWGEDTARKGEAALAVRRKERARAHRLAALQRRIESMAAKSQKILRDSEKAKSKTPLARGWRLLGNGAAGLAMLMGSLALAQALACEPWRMQPNGPWEWAGWAAQASLRWSVDLCAIFALLLPSALFAECAKRGGQTARGLLALLREPFFDLAQLILRAELKNWRDTDGGARRWEALEIRLAAEAARAGRGAQNAVSAKPSGPLDESAPALVASARAAARAASGEARPALSEPAAAPARARRL